jgi:hypothetical protein
MRGKRMDKIVIDMDAQKFAEVIHVFERIADALESIDEKTQKPKSMQAEFINNHKLANKPAPIRHAGRNSK